MKLIKQLDQLSSLDVPDEIRRSVQECLVEPFDGDVDLTEQFWEETNTFLVLIEDGDVDEGGYEVAADSEVNGITLHSVGYGTTLENLIVA